LKKGDPLCLIRVLWRNTTYGFPNPKLEKFQGYSLITVPARSVSPEFRIMIYPYRYGDPLPITNWNKTRTQLTVQIKDQKDTYDFAQTEGGRTVLSMNRNGEKALTSDAPPEKPVLLIRNSTYRQSDLRYTRDEQKIPVYLMDDHLHIEFVYPAAPAQIRYTLDGSEPNLLSPIYEKPIRIHQSTQLKARIYHPEWEQGNKFSDVLEASFIQKIPCKGLNELPTKHATGLNLEVFEISTKMYNNKGFLKPPKS